MSNRVLNIIAEKLSTGGHLIQLSSPSKLNRITDNNENIENTVETLRMQGVTEFADSAPTDTTNMGEAPTRPDSMMPGHERGNLSDFLARPVLLRSFAWTHGSNFTNVFDIYDEWRTNTAISKKLANYHLFRGNFHIAIKTNGMPFHIGRFQAKWLPPSTDTNITPGSIGETRMWLSQKPGTVVPLSPTSNDTFEMSIPFLCPNDYLRLTSRTDQDTLGDFRIESLTTLTTANANVVDAEISVYVWVENAELVVPTFQLASSKDSADEEAEQVVHSALDSAANYVKSSKLVEYLPNNIVSDTSSAIASAMGELSSIPIIGPFAATGSSFMNKASGFARFFGLSRSVIVTDHQYMKIRPFTSLSNTAGDETTQKMTFDPKQGISIDPRISGMPDGVDHMSIKHMASNWSFIDGFEWSTASTSGTRLYELLVSPNLAANSTTRVYSSMAFAAMPFEYWSGTIEYMFVFVVSDYHTGRVAISYDPAGSSHASLPSNEQYNQLVDIKKQTVFKTSVSWAQAEAYKKVGDQDLVLYSPLGVIYNSSLANGSVRLTVVNPLKGPDSTVNGHILVYARAGEDFEVSQPKTLYPNDSMQDSFVNKDSLFALASSPVDGNEMNQLVGAPSCTKADIKPTVFFGERVVSFRNLIKRYEAHRVMRPGDGGVTNEWVYARMNNFGFPSPYIENTSGTDQVPFNNTGVNPDCVCNTPLMTWLRPAFATWRGSIRWKAVLMTPDVEIGSMLARRTERNPNGSIFYGDTTELVQGGLLHVQSNSLVSLWEGVAAGAYNAGQTVLEWEVPFYLNRRYCYTDPFLINLGAVIGSAVDGSDTLQSSIELIFRQDTTPTDNLPLIQLFVAAGDDFSYELFLGSPVFDKQN